MLTLRKNAVKLATATVLTAVVAVSAFADWRRQPGTWNDAQKRVDTQGPTYRENERVTVQGTITSVTAHLDGYRVHLDRSRYAFFIPDSHVRNIGRDLRNGAFIEVSGIVRKGLIWVDRIGDARDSRRFERLYGVVEEVDLVRETMWIRDRDSGRRIRVDADRLARRSRIDLEDLRRGDSVVLAGEWNGRDFEAWRIESVRSGRR